MEILIWFDYTVWIESTGDPAEEEVEVVGMTTETVGIVARHHPTVAVVATHVHALTPHVSKTVPFFTPEIHFLTCKI